MIYLRLCKAGYVRSIAEAEELEARTVIQALAYEGFLADYDLAFWELNREHR